jgi:hypothetical protein
MKENQELAVVKESSLTAIDIRKQVNLIQEVMKNVMKENVHFGKVPGCGDKPTLLKPGAEKLMMTFRLAAEYDELPGSCESDTQVLYKINCKLTHIPTGLGVGNGRGTCSSKEKKYKTRAVYANRATDEEKAIGKLEKRTNLKGSFDVYIIPQDPWDVQNTIYKMACKRALIAAVLNAASDLFAQDIEELPEGTVIEDEIQEARPEVKQPIKKTATPVEDKPKETDPAPKHKAQNPISIPQSKRLFAIAMGNGYTAEDLNVYLQENYGISDSKDIEREHYEAIVEHFQAKKDTDA